MTRTDGAAGLPVIDMAALFDAADSAGRQTAAAAIQSACRESGFFYVTGHGVASSLVSALEAASHRFFALPEADKMAIAMAKGGPAWRGYFPVGAELTSGRPDIKQGLYLGSELPRDHPRVAAGWPLHGANLWPTQVPELRDAALAYMAATARAARALLEGIALSLGIAPGYFEDHYTAEPTILFRIFHYPAPAPSDDDESEAGDGPAPWGVGEHSDYGLLTLLAQDRHGGLQVKTPGGWIDAPPLPGSLVCNIGDMLDRLTGGWYRSTPHRVRNVSGRDRLSFPLFFDPDFTAVMRPLPESAAKPTAGTGILGEPRWDGADLQAFEGTYGDYLMGKVAKVFPNLGQKVL